MPIKRTSYARYDIWYHFVWGTKYRKKIFTEESTRRQVEIIFRTIADQYDMEIGEVTRTIDHIHFTAGAPPKIVPSRIVQILKSVSMKRCSYNSLG